MFCADGEAVKEKSITHAKRNLSSTGSIHFERKMPRTVYGKQARRMMLNRISHREQCNVQNGSSHVGENVFVTPGEYASVK